MVRYGTENEGKSSQCPSVSLENKIILRITTMSSCLEANKRGVTPQCSLLQLRFFQFYLYILLFYFYFVSFIFSLVLYSHFCFLMIIYSLSLFIMCIFNRKKSIVQLNAWLLLFFYCA